MTNQTLLVTNQILTDIAPRHIFSATPLCSSRTAQH